MKKLTPPRMLILSFLCVIIIGTIALSLPMATREPGRMSLVDSLFTATSATCVTGLIVRDTGSYFTPFGRWIIFALFQAGGLGIMTFSTLFAVILGRRISLREGDVVRSTLQGQNILGLNRLIGYILGITFTVELIGASILAGRWKSITDCTILQAMERGVFHSVSAFCNAGFALFRTSLMGFQGDAVINLTMMALIIIGGIGFVVIMDVIGLIFRRGAVKRLSLQSKIALSMTGILIIAGTLLLFLFEKDNTMRTLTWSQKLMGAAFQSVTARTAGFNTLPIGSMAKPSLMALLLLMFIGASPGSTGGGIKTSTFAVVVATVWNMFQNNKRVQMFNRSVSLKIIREAFVIFFISITWIFVFTMILGYLHIRKYYVGPSFLQMLFEVTSAFGTVGLSTGITQSLDSASKLCITLTMFVGRLGPLTLALAAALHERRDKFVYPEEDIMVG